MTSEHQQYITTWSLWKQGLGVWWTDHSSSLIHSAGPGRQTWVPCPSPPFLSCWLLGGYGQWEGPAGDKRGREKIAWVCVLAPSAAWLTNSSNPSSIVPALTAPGDTIISSPVPSVPWVWTASLCYCSWASGYACLVAHTSVNVSSSESLEVDSISCKAPWLILQVSSMKPHKTPPITTAPLWR